MTQTIQQASGQTCTCRTACILGGIDACTLPLDHEGPHRTEGRARVCSWPQGPSAPARAVRAVREGRQRAEGEVLMSMTETIQRATVQPLTQCPSCRAFTKVKPSGRFIAHHALHPFGDNFYRCIMSGRTVGFAETADEHEHVNCARCGGDAVFERCDQCEDGYTAPGELYEGDPLWYDEDDTEPCSTCHGEGGFRFCGNSDAWCQDNPLPGREGVKDGALERRPCWTAGCF